MNNNDTIYHIFLDRFAGNIIDDTKADFAGGTLQGITSKLGYIKDLGCTAVWLSPFYKTVAYHGYHITDFYAVDPHFGSEADLEILIKQAHQLNLKVYVDFVPNHLSKYNPYFLDAQKKKKSKYRNWFFFDKWPNRYKSFLYFDEIPKINLNNPEAREHIIGSALHWAKFGIDGFRVDHAIGPSLEYNAKFYRRLKSEYPDIYLFGEVWADGVNRHMFQTIDIPRKWIRKWFGINQAKLQLDYHKYFDGILDFHAQKLIMQGATVRHLAKHFRKYPDGFDPICFLDNHDMNRLMFQCGNDIGKFKQTIQRLTILPHPIVLYYGTEQALTHPETIKSGKPHADLQVRKTMNWKKTGGEIEEYIRQCLNKRNQEK